jgi:hypothetical protein
LKDIFYGRLHKIFGSFGNIAMKIEIIATDGYEVSRGFPDGKVP